MQGLLSGFVLALLTFNVAVVAMSDENTSEVKDKAAALSIAESACAEKFGNEFWDKFRPYSVELKDDTWIVIGTSKDGSTRGGGMPEIEISQIDGVVKKIHLSR